MSLIVVAAIRGQCASFMILTVTVSDIFGGQTNASILVVQIDDFRMDIMPPNVWREVPPDDHDNIVTCV